jgi:precorrin-6x reductase
MMRASGWIEYSPINIWRCINYAPMRKEWDPNSDDIHFISKIGVNAYTCYNLSKRVFIVAGREFILDFFTNMEADG